MGIFFCADCCCGSFCAGNGYLFALGLLLWRFLRGKWVSFCARIVVVGVSAREMGIFLRSDCCCGRFCAGNGYHFVLGKENTSCLRGKLPSFPPGLPGVTILRGKRVSFCARKIQGKKINLCQELTKSAISFAEKRRELWEYY